MSCGTKLTSHDNYDLSLRLEREGEHGLASDIRNGRCLDSYDLRRAEYALERQGMQEHWDYNKDRCYCDE